MGHLEDIHLFRDLNAFLDIPSQESCSLTGFQQQDDGIIVLVVSLWDPTGRRVQDREWPDRLSGGYPANPDLLFLETLDQLPIPGDHRIAAQPAFSDPEACEPGEQAIHVIVMRMCQDHSVQPAYAARKQIG